MKMTIPHRLLLLGTGLLAAWQIAVGIDRMSTPAMLAYTVGFGVLLVAGVLLVILGLDVLDNPAVVIISTIIPLSLALGLVWDYLPAIRIFALVFALLGFLAIILTRSVPMKNRMPVIVLAVVHGFAGLTIFILPMVLAFTHQATSGFLLVGVGGALIGAGGMLLAFLKTGKPILSRQTIFTILPALLFLMTAAFVFGFAAA
jgi:hypothetical protein